MGKTISLAQLKHKVEQVTREVGLHLKGATLENPTINGVPFLRSDGGWRERTVFDGVSFGTWYDTDPDRATLVTVSVECVGDDDIMIDVDRDGTGGVTHTQYVANAGGGGSDTDTIVVSGTTYVPPGGSYRVTNDDDTDDSNIFTKAIELNL